MHNNIMAVGSRDRPPMLATGRYAQWQSYFMRHIDTKPNNVELRKCILQGLYELSEIVIPGQPSTDDSPAVLPRTVPETILNISLENKANYDAEPEVIHLILIGIRDDISSTFDACKTAHDTWIAIERLQQEWSRFVTIVKQTQEFDKESYHKLFDILKQYQKEANEIRAEKIVRNANPLALVAAAQQYPDSYYQASKSYKSYAPPSKQSSYTRSHATTRNKGKEIAKTITHPSESASEEDEESDPEQAQRDKEMQKNLPLIAKKPKRAKDYTYHKEKMLMCKQAEKGVPLHAEQSDSLDDTDEEIDEQELEAHYSFMAKIQDRQHSEQPESINDTYVVEKVESNVIPDSSDMCNNDIQADQNAEECDDERVVLANLIANLKLDTNENKKIQKQLKKANTSLSHELKECNSALEECKSSLEESNRTRDRYLGALHDLEVELAKYKRYNDCTLENDRLECKLKEIIRLLAQKEIDSKEVLKKKDMNFLWKKRKSIS
ncbi:hypothetical protein Tco_0689744 [Tanacetum coccineum]